MKDSSPFAELASRWFCVLFLSRQEAILTRGDSCGSTQRPVTKEKSHFHGGSELRAPSQKGSTHRVFDQQVDAEEGSEPAQQTEYGFWQSLLR
jgi:hypothetical protein